MGNRISSPSYVTGLSRIKAVDIENSLSKPERTLKHLLRANHHNYAVLNKLGFHNHLPHALGSAYFLGASETQIQELYDSESQELEPWVDSPEEISETDWICFLGNTLSQRAYLDFFEDELVRLDYDWKRVVMKYMLSQPNPLINGAIVGLGNPLIHMGYAFELNNREVGMEALVLSAINYNYMHQYIDNDDRKLCLNTHCDQMDISALDIIGQIISDSRLNNLFNQPGGANMTGLFGNPMNESLIMGYFHRLSIKDISSSHRELCKLSALLLCATHFPGTPNYDFFICHLLTTSYALRVILPELPSEFAQPLLKSHWLLIISTYCTQLRPLIRPELIDLIECHGKSWEDIIQRALAQRKSGKAQTPDSHYLQVIRIFRTYSTLWNDDKDFYHKAAIKFTWEFNEWSGFG